MNEFVWHGVSYDLTWVTAATRFDEIRDRSRSLFMGRGVPDNYAAMAAYREAAGARYAALSYRGPTSTGGSPVTTGAGSPTDFYGDGIVSLAAMEPRVEMMPGLVPVPRPQLVGVGAVTIAGLIAMISRVAPAVSVTAIRNALSRAIVAGRLRWGMLPGWLQSLLVLVGFTAGQEILIDTGPDDTGILQWPGTSDRPSPASGAVTVAKTWTANGVEMALLSDGRMAAWSSRKNAWTIWRPKKPIVLFATGAQDLPTLLRADRAIDRQSKRLKRMIDRQKPSVRQICFRCGKTRNSCTCQLS